MTKGLIAGMITYALLVCVPTLAGGLFGFALGAFLAVAMAGKAFISLVAGLLVSRHLAERGHGATGYLFATPVVAVLAALAQQLVPVMAHSLRPGGQAMTGASPGAIFAIAVVMLIAGGVAGHAAAREDCWL